MMDLIGLWALRHACECARNQLKSVRVAVNVSPVQLADPEFVSLVQSVLESTGLPADRLELEITESVFIEDTEAALKQLHALHALGIHVALDDFGTGYSSLSYLCAFRSAPSRLIAALCRKPWSALGAGRGAAHCAAGTVP